jgi:hypothetical protein
MRSIDSHRALGAVFALFFVDACAPIVLKTAVRGDPVIVEQLVGEWEGTYSSPKTGRSGSISFRLRAGTDTAEGTVVMTSPRGTQGSYPDENVMVSPTPGKAPQLLTIRFVNIAGNEVRGILDSYQDPDCGCTLTTTFRGRLTGDVIQGTFVSEGNGPFHTPADGTWRVMRAQKAR